MKKELTSILYVHSNLEEFFKHVPQSILPKDYGGQEPDCMEMRGEEILIFKLFTILL